MTGKQMIIAGGLLTVLIASALSAIYTKYYSRQLFIEIQKQEKLIDQYEVKWWQLQLELATFKEHDKIEKWARRNLKLVMPEKEKIVYLKP